MRAVISVCMLLLCLAGCATPHAAVLTPDAVRERPDDYVIVAVRNEPSAATAVGTTARHYSGVEYMQSSSARQALRALAAAHQLQEVSGWPITELAMHCVIFKKRADVNLDELIDTLRHDPHVLLVQPLQVFATHTDATQTNHGQAEENNTDNHQYNDPYAPLQTNLVEMNVDAAHQWSHGKDVRVAIVDTGVDVTHPDLAQRIAGRQNFVDHSDRQFLADQHGTAVAGVIGANINNHIGIVGIAPEARLYVFKACWQLQPGHDQAQCNSFTLAQALMAAIQARAQLINLSVVGPADPLLSALLERAQQQGIIVVGAAAERSGFPAQVQQVIAVAELGDATVAGDKVLRAPGRDVLTLRPNGRYDFASGSSIATAEVTGAAALLLARPPARGLPPWDAEHVRQALLQRGLAQGANSAVLPCSSTDSLSANPCNGISRLSRIRALQ